jgi:hypothetical protein
MPDALAWLAENERAFRELVGALTGRPMSRTTTWKWRRGMRKPSTAELALIELVRRNPELMEIER